MSFAFNFQIGGSQSIAPQWKKLIEKAELHQTDALVVYQNNKEIINWSSSVRRRPIQIMSATKSLVGLAFMKLLSDGNLDSLNQRVFEFYPEWNQGMKKRISIRHLLSHTSGLQEHWDEIGVSPDELKLALAAELNSAPGESFPIQQQGTEYTRWNN